MVQRRVVDLGAPLGIDRLHQVDLDRERPRTGDGDVLVHVLLLASVVALRVESEEVDPEAAQA